MLRKIIVLLLTLSLVLGVSGCTVSGNDTSSEDIYSEDTATISSEEESSKDDKSDQSSSKKDKNSSKPKSSKTSKTSEVSSKKYPARERTISITRRNRDYFKTVGRCVPTSSVASGLYLPWTASSVEFDIDCVGGITLSFSRDGSSVVFIEIYVDGKLFEERTEINQNSQNVTVGEGLEAGIHRIKIVRQTDCEGALIALNRISAVGWLVEKAPDYSNIFMECIGDASIIGWGVRLEDSFYKDFQTNTHQSTARNRENQDGTLAYTYVAAQKLNADTYALARQGAGIACTYHKTTVSDRESPAYGLTIGNARAGLLPTMYDYATTKTSNVEYVATRKPNVIVIDAGAADLSASLQKEMWYDNTRGGDIDTAKNIAVDFLKELKEKNPDVKIIWCYGLCNKASNVSGYIQSVVEKAGGASAGIYSLEVPYATRTAHYPSKADHEAAANVLAKKVKEILK